MTQKPKHSPDELLRIQEQERVFAGQTSSLLWGQAAPPKLPAMQPGETRGQFRARLAREREMQEDLERDPRRVGGRVLPALPQD